MSVCRPGDFGNPWIVGTPGRVTLTLDGAKTEYHLPRDLTAEDAAKMFSIWIEGYSIPFDMKPDCLNRQGRRAMWDHLAARRAQIFDRLPDLRGKDLACWCPLDAPCHADVLLRMANTPSGK
ncbi:uncharacterized protein DUF4326 [Salipiger aestuarii]|uniref:Uncharacterized protein DUF4326 n=2 Tax=Salipiger aestuarii TaxID=568098 RepID=A0A327YT26_9RHOB|nr:uncharacterized protein DUF4326 [Salipiger aestuarii]